MMIHETLDEAIAEREELWSSQIMYRVAVLTEGGWRITTPWIARRRGYRTIREFHPE
jgi:hypothetical protein